MTATKEAVLMMEPPTWRSWSRRLGSARDQDREAKAVNVSKDAKLNGRSLCRMRTFA